MLKKGLKNYLVCLKHYFVPLGVFSIFVVIGISIGIPMISSAFKTLFDEISKVIASAKNTNWLDLFSRLVAHVNAAFIDKDFNTALKEVTTVQWLTDTLKLIVQEICGEGATIENLTALVQAVVTSIISALILIVVMAVVGIFVGFFLTKFLIRKSMTKRSVWKILLMSLVDALLLVASLLISQLLGKVANWVSIVFTIVALVGYGFFAIWEAFIFYGYKKIKLKEVLKIRNVLLLYLVGLIILLITIALVVIMFFIFRPIAAIYLAIPFVEIGLSVIGFNAEGYVAQVADEKDALNKKKEIATTKA